MHTGCLVLDNKWVFSSKDPQLSQSHMGFAQIVQQLFHKMLVLKNLGI